jgi:hypothetical protein
MSRHSELTDQVKKKAMEYLEGGYLTADEVVPTIAGLSCWLDVARKTIYNWAESDQEFLHITEKIMGSQEKSLLNSALSGKFNAAITKLMLTKHGYSDKQETEITGANGGPAVILERVFVDPAKDNN